MTNVLVIVVDDMRWDHLRYLPEVRTLIEGPGRRFDQARCNVPLCQPNRVGLLSGQLSHDHGELDVGFDGTVFTAHDDAIAAWMADAGYRCGLFGKYINFWDGFGGLDAPAGWATWRQLIGDRGQSDFDVHLEREVRTIRDRYPTEYLADEVEAFVTGGGSEPWFCYLAPNHPHAPFAPHPDNLHAWSNERCRIVDLPDDTDKPDRIRALRPLDTHERASIQQGFRGRLRELSAVDRLVGAVLGTLRKTGQLQDTVVMFTSDNGVHQGEQRLRGDGTKGGPYDVGLRVPFLARGPGFGPGPIVTTPVYPMQDITATAMAIAGARATQPHQAGIDLRAVARAPDKHRERVLLHELAPGIGYTADGITTGPEHPVGYWKLFRSPAVRDGVSGLRTYEMYDLRRDPDELVNVANKPAVREVRDKLEADLDRLLGAS